METANVIVVCIVSWRNYIWNDYLWWIICGTVNKVQETTSEGLKKLSNEPLLYRGREIAEQSLTNVTLSQILCTDLVWEENVPVQ